LWSGERGRYRKCRPGEGIQAAIADAGGAILGAAAIQAVERDNDVLVDGGYALEPVDLLFVLRTLAGEHERDVT
jgi:hypothetical protein